MLLRIVLLRADVRVVEEVFATRAVLYTYVVSGKARRSMKGAQQEGTHSESAARGNTGGGGEESHYCWYLRTESAVLSREICQPGVCCKR